MRSVDIDLGDMQSMGETFEDSNTGSKKAQLERAV